MAASIIPDTHRFVQRLVAAGMPAEQAEALKLELSENIIDLGDLATKDFVRAHLADIRTELRWIKVVGAALVASMAGLYWQMFTMNATLAEHSLVLEQIVAKLP